MFSDKTRDIAIILAFICWHISQIQCEGVIGVMARLVVGYFGVMRLISVIIFYKSYVVL